MIEEKKDIKNNDIVKNNLNAAMSYFWILSLYVYLKHKKSKFAQFHAKQGVILFIASFATVVPGIGQLFGIVLLFAAVSACLKAYKGEWHKLPFVYDLSKKIKF